MHFIDRVSLGKTLSGRLADLRGKDAVIVCLKEDSLLTCLSMARHLRAWVYPLAFTQIYSQDLMRTLLGAVDQDAIFYPYIPETSLFAPTEPVSKDDPMVHAQLQQAADQAKQQLQRYDLWLDKRVMNGRDVIFVADVLTDTMPLFVIQGMFQNITPKSISVAVGNATTQVMDLLRVSADNTVILDVLGGIARDDSNYFEQQDTYTAEQKYQLTHHITAYWE